MKLVFSKARFKHKLSHIENINEIFSKARFKHKFSQVENTNLAGVQT